MKRFVFTTYTAGATGRPLVCWDRQEEATDTLVREAGFVPPHGCVGVLSAEWHGYRRGAFVVASDVGLLPGARFSVSDRPMS